MTNTRFVTLLKRGVAEVITEAELLKLLNSGRMLTLKQGFDPSAPDIHLGHVVGLRKLRQFQELGHKVILIVGDWTARIGDPSGQSATRPMLTPNEIERNAQTYMEQFFKVVDKDKTELRWQSEWFARFTLDEVIKLTSKVTIAQLLAREDFNKRYSSGSPISLAEMLYPLLQGYDSVAIKADVEFGGIDQKFNCLVGRELQQSMGQSPQQVFLVPLLIGTDGHQKMSKSLHNHIGVAEPPQEIYGKVMSIPDLLIVDYFELVTDVPEEEITEFKKQLKTHSVNPMNLKKRLAHEIVRQFHGRQAADEAEEHFTQVVQKRETPEETLAYKESFKKLQGVFISGLIYASGLASSKSEAKRLIAAGSVEIDAKRIPKEMVIAYQDGRLIMTEDGKIVAEDGSIIKVGKRRFAKIIDADKEKIINEEVKMQLRIPGPTPCPPQALEAMGRQMINHRGGEFGKILNSITGKLKQTFQTKGDVFVLTGSGTGGLEAAIVNTLSPGDKVLSLANGVFGERFVDIAEKYGAEIIRLNFEWGKPVGLDAIEKVLKTDGNIKAVLATHNETSTGVTNNIKEISTVVKKFDKLLLVDAISSLGCINLPTDDWNCDIVVTASQKGWMVPPGLAMVSVSEKAWQAHAKAKMPRYYWDFSKAKDYLQKGQTPWTPAISVFFALDVTLDLMLSEGLDNIFARHARVAQAARNGVKSLGLSLFPDEKYASNTVTAVNAADKIDVPKLIQILQNEYEVILAGGQQKLSGKIFRIGHLGLVYEKDIKSVLDALDKALPRAKKG